MIYLRCFILLAKASSSPWSFPLFSLCVNVKSVLEVQFEVVRRVHTCGAPTAPPPRATMKMYNEIGIGQEKQIKELKEIFICSAVRVDRYQLSS